ncbi:8477_t:CDS:2 [Diversispora eburnea]|uniref:8477_t:CDS:1 n=1 Tax=Diversispora eburnea TaxID=1213867 RepID=A0A9N9ACK3_9GLOM|nr:8477_t:CDS:2 [Diversispora eburnea]
MEFLVTLRNFIRRPAQDTLPRIPIDSSTSTEIPSIAGAFATQHSRSENSEFAYTYNRKVVKILDKIDFEVFSIFDIRKYNREIKTRNDYLIKEIVKVTDCYIDNACLLLCTRDTNNDYRFILYDIYENKSYTLPVNLKKIGHTVIYDVMLSEQIVHTVKAGFELPNSFFLVLGTSIGISLYRLLAPTPQAPYFKLVDECYQHLATKEPVSSVCLYKSNNVVEETQYLIAGGVRGLVEFFSYDFDRKLQFIQSLEVPESMAPVTHIVARPQRDSDKGLFFIGHGRLLDHNDFLIRNDYKPLIRFIRISYTHDNLLCQEFKQRYEGRPGSNVSNGRIISMSASVDEMNHILCIGLESTYLERDANDGPELALFKIEDAERVDTICWKNIVSLCGHSSIYDIDAPKLLTKVDILLPDKIVSFDLSGQQQEGEEFYDPLPEFEEFFTESDFKKYNIYGNQIIGSIQQRRSQMNNELIFDLLLQFAKVDPSLYPPINMAGLRLLFNQIFNSAVDRLRQHCLVYYLLKDWQGAANYRHQRYAARFLIPPNFLCLMDGYWALDHWLFAEAIRFLTEPSVSVDWDHKVMQVLVDHSSPRDALTYANLTQVDKILSDNPKKTENLVIHMEILMRCDILEAFDFQRKCRPQPIEGQPLELLLLRNLLDYCFYPNPNAERLTSLLNINMDKYEEEFTKKYCESHDLVECKIFWIYYTLHHGDIVESIKLNEILKRQGGGTESKIANSHLRNKYFAGLMEKLSPSQQKEISMEVDEITSKDTVVMVEEMIDVNINEEVTVLDEEMTNRSLEPINEKMTTHQTSPNKELPSLPNHSPFSTPQNERTPKTPEPPRSKRKGRSTNTDSPKTPRSFTTPDRRITRSMSRTMTTTSNMK